MEFKMMAKLRDFYYLILKEIFFLFERYLKIHITPVHFYSPIPNTAKLNPKIFEKIYSDTGLNWNIQWQLSNLNIVFKKYLSEYTPSVNSGLSLVDSFILYAMVRENKPKVMIEVGSGETTKISLLAIQMNKKYGYKGKFYAIEPNPSDSLRKISNENFILIEKRLEQVELDFLTTADLFFIDSSHVSKIGSDVNYEILEVVPNLRKHSIIHWHDIMLPADYYKDWIYRGNMFWNESYLLHAFMLFNDAFEIEWASRYMQLNYSLAIKKQFLFFQEDKHRCTSFWIRKIK